MFRTRNIEHPVIRSQKGVLMIMVMVALALMAIMALQVRSTWQRDNIREMEKELIFRGRQYVQAIEAYNKANPASSIESFKVLYEKKHIRRLYPDPMTEDGQWNLVMQPTTPDKKKLQVISPAQLPQFLSSAKLVGVCSACTDEAMLEYREKQRYSEWAFFVGDDPSKKMPELEYMFERP